MSVSNTKSALTCRPLDTIEEVFSFVEEPPAWRSLCTEYKEHSTQAIRNSEIIENDGKSAQSTTDFCHFEPLSQFDIKRHDNKNMSKILVCHDMANGYHDDSYINGTENYEAYNFYNWCGIDVFCYFSHHLVTIPPLCWINAAHSHGVQIIGTIITEHKEGMLLWERVLSCEQQWRRLADALAAICKCMRFDGWLLNIENKISNPRALLSFVHYLHNVLHAEVTGALLLWYDSVTVDGHLAWQNTLNKHNKAFLDATDGLFTNYSWKESDLVTIAANADGRAADVYVGVDVWGRNFIGGGKFNTAHAVALAQAHNCSMAIFAPAWTHEAITPPPPSAPLHSSDRLCLYDNFMLRDRALWSSLWPFMKTRLPSQLPFMTSFCRGHGINKYLHGELISGGAWFNMREMQYQPNSAHGTHGWRHCGGTLCYMPGERQCIEHYIADAFNGGACVRINTSDVNDDTHRTIRLLHCDFEVQHELVVCVVTKRLAENREQYLNVMLQVEGGGVGHKYVLYGKRMSGVTSRARHNVYIANDTQLDAIQKYLLTEAPHCYVPMENQHGWHVKYVSTIIWTTKHDHTTPQPSQLSSSTQSFK